MCNKVIGPFFFQQKTITADIYLQTLTEYVPPQLEEFQAHILFQQDGAPPHWGKKVREFLDQKFSNRWIGRDGPIFWPPRSPDITPLDFFLWGYVKDIVYRTKVKDISDLKERIIAAVNTIDDEMLRKTWTEIENRLCILFAANGAHIEIQWAPKETRHRENLLIFVPRNFSIVSYFLFFVVLISLYTIQLFP